MAGDALGGDFVKTDSGDLRRGSRKAAFDNAGRDPDRFEDLGSLVAVEDGDAHLRHDLENAFFERLVVLCQGLLHGDPVEFPFLVLLDEFTDGLVGEPGADRRRAEADEAGDVVGVTRLGRIDDEAGVHALFHEAEVVMHRADGEQRRDADALVINGPVREHKQLRPAQDRRCGLFAKILKGVAESVGPAQERPGHVYRFRGEKIVRFECLELMAEKQRRGQVHDAGVLGRFHEDIAFGPEVGLEGHHEIFADGIDGRVGDLGEELFEISKEHFGLAREHRQGGIVTHGVDGLLSGRGHGSEDHVELFLTETVGDLKLGKGQRIVRGIWFNLRLGRDDVGELDLIFTEPFPVGLLRGEVLFDFLIKDDFAFNGVDHDHLAGGEAAFLRDFVVGEITGPDLGAEGENAVGRDFVAGGAETVAVEAGGDGASVRKCQRGRAIPRFAEAAMIAEEVLDRLTREGIDAPGRRHEHGHGVRDGAAREDEQLEGRIETGRVRPVRVEGVVEKFQVFAPDLALELPDAGAEPVAIAPHRIDLAIVAEHAERLRECPGREGVGGKALVIEADRGLEVFVDEIEVKFLHGRGDHESFIIDETTAQRGDVKTADQLAVRKVLDLAAAEVELALKGLVIKPLGA